MKLNDALARLLSSRQHNARTTRTTETQHGAPRHRVRSIVAAGASGLMVLLSLAGMPIAANAAGETLQITLTQATGTVPFDADDAAGHDSSATNDIVRTNDTVAYTVGVRYEGGDQTNPVITFTLPKGEELISLPAYCLQPGSSETPADIPDPTIPVTATSWTTLPAQTIVCKVAPQAAGTALDYTFLSTVRPEVPNGTALDPVTVQVTSDQVTTPVVSAPVDHSVSAAPQFDLSKRLNGSSDTSGPLFSQYIPCSFDNAQTCRWTEYPLTISAPAGGKGVAPLATPITFTDDLSADVFYPAGTTSDPDWIAAGAGAADKYGARMVGCGGTGPLNLHGFIPNQSGGSVTNVRAVRNSGTITCAQPGGPGTPVQFTITGADTTAVTYPTQNTDGGALPADLALVVSTTIIVEIPLTAITDLGTASGNTFALATHNTFTDVVAADVTGTPSIDNPVNNVRDTVERLEVSDGEIAKAFVGITGRPGNTAPAGFGGVWEGLPGSSSYRDGNTVVVKDQTVISALTYSRYDIPPNSGTQYSNTSIMCDVWDDTKLGLPSTFAYAGAASTNLRAPSNGSPVWMASEYSGGAIATDPAPSGLRFQYSYTPTPGPGIASSCATGQWFDSPAQVPGATLVDGVWQGVNQVRASFTDRAATTAGAYQLNIAIALEVVSTDATGTVLPNWASRMVSTGVKSLEAVITAPDRRDNNSTYDPATAGGGLGDRLILGAANARIVKFVKNPTTGEFTNTAVPQYTAGSMIDYRLNPSLTADVSAGTFSDVSVEDCLPEYQMFVSSAREGGAALAPTVVQQGSPVGAGLTCAAGETYLRWDLGSQEVNVPIDPIVYTVEVLATVRNATYTNTTLVSSPADGSSAAARTDTAQVLIEVPTGIKIAKSVDKPVVEVTPDDATTPRGFTWTVDFANIDSPQNVSNVDVIDVLPADGLGGSQFTGTLTLDSVTPTGGTTGVDVLYTATPSAQLAVDPDDATNGASGSTVWCDAPSGGSVVSGSGTDADCPTSLGAATGLRFLRDGAFTPTDTLKMTIAMTPRGNAHGDIYENRTAGRVDGVSLPVGPAIRQVNVVASQIGDRVWDDLNSNGILDDGEPAIVGMTVTLSGTDVDGNAITATSVTDPLGRYIFQGLPSGTYTVTFDKAWADDHGYAFTTQTAGTDATIDSDADPATGVAGPIALGVNEERLDIDAGLVRILGGLVIVKDIAGAGSGQATGPFEFSVVCTLEDATVYEGTVTLDRINESTTLTSERIGDIPVGASCLVTETNTGGADETPAPVTVLIVTNDDDNTVTAGFVNEFSAGTIAVEKVLAGTGANTDAVKAKVFTVEVTCQVLLDDVEGPVTVFSQAVQIKGGQTVTLEDADGEPILLPLGSVCFGVETDNGGAKTAVVDYDSFENGVTVESGTPDELQALKVTATNTFDAVVPPAPTEPTSGLAITGADPTWLLIMALLLLGGGGTFLVMRRRNRVDAQV